MGHYITDACIGTTDMSCVEVCPVDCIYSVGQDAEVPDQPYMLVIDNEECIDCGACIPECPVEAIMMTENVPGKWEGFIAVNDMHIGRGDGNGPDEESSADKADIAKAAEKLHSQLEGDSGET